MATKKTNRVFMGVFLRSRCKSRVGHHWYHKTLHENPNNFHERDFKQASSGADTCKNTDLFVEEREEENRWRGEILRRERGSRPGGVFL